MFVISTPWLIADITKIVRLEKSERAHVNMLLLTSFNILASAMVVLQLVNWLLLKQPWPFFLALTVIISGAFQQFVLLVRMRIREDKSDAA